MVGNERERERKSGGKSRRERRGWRISISERVQTETLPSQRERERDHEMIERRWRSAENSGRERRQVITAREIRKG